MQLVLFLHISKTDQLKDQRGLCSYGLKNLKRVARTHFIVSHRRQAAPFTSKSLKPPGLAERGFASLFRGPDVSWDNWRSSSFGLSGGCMDACRCAQPPVWGMRQGRCSFQVSLISGGIWALSGGLRMGRKWGVPVNFNAAALTAVAQCPIRMDHQASDLV